MWSDQLAYETRYWVIFPTTAAEPILVNMIVTSLNYAHEAQGGQQYNNKNNTINVFHPHVGHTHMRATLRDKNASLTHHTMAPPHHTEKVQKEGRLTLAINAIQKNQISSRREAAAVYGVSRTTLQARLHGRVPKLGSRCKSRLLSESEEAVLISWIRSMERRGFPPFIIDVRRMAQSLIHSRGSKPPKRVGKQWIYKFLKQHPQLDARLARS